MAFPTWACSGPRHLPAGRRARGTQERTPSRAPGFQHHFQPHALPRAQPCDRSWLRGEAGRVRLREAPSTQLKLLPSKKGRMKTGHTGGRCGPRPPVCAAPGPGTSAHSSAGRWSETSGDAVVRPARQAWSCDPATRGAKGAPCPKELTVCAGDRRSQGTRVHVTGHGSHSRSRTLIINLKIKTQPN